MILLCISKLSWKIYEYAQLKFAQRLVKRKNNINLYIHTKGAQITLKIVEYSGLNKFKYINPIKNNITDITYISLNKGRIFWFNSCFINKNHLK